LGVEAEEKLNVAHGVRLGAVHVSQKEVAKLDGVQTREQYPPLARKLAKIDKLEA
jgi:hypothetical protein